MVVRKPTYKEWWPRSSRVHLYQYHQILANVGFSISYMEHRDLNTSKPRDQMGFVFLKISVPIITSLATKKQSVSPKGSIVSRWCFQRFFQYMFTSMWGNDPIWRSYFSMKPPTMSLCRIFHCSSRRVDCCRGKDTGQTWGGGAMSFRRFFVRRLENGWIGSKKSFNWDEFSFFFLGGFMVVDVCTENIVQLYIYIIWLLGCPAGT